MTKSLLAVVSHPDDETFGCGGTLAVHADAGADVDVICLTCTPPGRRLELENAAEILGINEPMIFDAEEITFEDALVKRVRDVIAEVRPRAVITHLPFDYHREHRATYELVKEAVEWAAHTTGSWEPWSVGRLLLMEVNTLIPTPHVLVDISGTIERKMVAVDCYTTQLAKFPWGYYQDLSMKKAELRGVQGGCGHAEAFVEESLPVNGPFYPVKSTRSLLE
ncbi:MAG TPA: PIG-L deacetylase family protein [Patescibacteria group bacterium]|nr:PIG-L deacetylase family protein [Patescibacteria group bacterium]